MPGKKRDDRVNDGVRLLLGLKMAAGNGPSFDLGCPGLLDRERRDLFLYLTLICAAGVRSTSEATSVIISRNHASAGSI